MRVVLHICCQMQTGSTGLRYVNSGPRQIQCNYISCYSVFNIQLIVSPLVLLVYRHIDACYAPHLLQNKASIILPSLCQLWSQSNIIYLHFLLFRHQYSNERIPADIGEMSTIQCALYSTFAAIFSINPRDYAMSYLVPAKSNIITVHPMQASTFNRMYIRYD
jgi:hypothetical protein